MFVIVWPEQEASHSAISVVHASGGDGDGGGALLKVLDVGPLPVAPTPQADSYLQNRPAFDPVGQQ